MSGLAEVTSPPYDVVGASAFEHLTDADPHNVVRLTLPNSEPGGDPSEASGGRGGREAGRWHRSRVRAHSRRIRSVWYHTAGRMLRQWLADGVLVPDASAGLYLYEERSARIPLGLQRGIIGALALSPPAAGIVLPHEGVAGAVVAHRRQLMEATEANLEPIFLLYEGGGTASQLVDEVAEIEQPTVEAATDDCVRHRLWAVTDATRVAAVAADLAGRHAMIADGHHRYAAYLEMQARRHAAGFGCGPWDFGMALLVDSGVYPPRIDAIHRVLPGLPPASAIALARTAFRVRKLPRSADLGTALRALRDAGHGDAVPAGTGAHGPAAPASGQAGAGRCRTAFLLVGDDRSYLLTDPDPAQLRAATPAGRSERWQRLDTSILHELLIRTIWGIEDNETAVRMVHHDPVAAIAAAAPGGTAVICNPLPVSDVLAVAAGGEHLPRKSTSFRPKPRTGLVIRSFAYG